MESPRTHEEKRKGMIFFVTAQSNSTLAVFEMDVLDMMSVSRTVEIHLTPKQHEEARMQEISNSSLHGD